MIMDEFKTQTTSTNSSKNTINGKTEVDSLVIETTEKLPIC